MKISFEQMQAFISVAETGSFSAAARGLRKDRATLHQQVGNLEIDWNITLFDREGRKPTLTPNGHAMLNHAKIIMHQIESINSRSKSLSLGEEEQINIVHDISVSAAQISRIQAKVYQRYPNTQINWLLRGRSDALAALTDKEAELVIVVSDGNATPIKGLNFINLGYPKFYFYTHKNNNLASSSSVDVVDLQSQRQYIFEQHAQTTLGSKMIYSPDKALISSIDVLFEVLRTGGWAILPSEIVESHPNAQEFVPLNTSFLNGSGRWSYILMNNTMHQLGPVATFAKSMIVEEFKQLVELQR